MKVQLLPPKKFWVQGKNLGTPWRECNVASCANFIEAAGLSYWIGVRRLPDVLDDLCSGEIGHLMAKQLGYEGEPRELFAVMAWAVNVVCGKEAAHFYDTKDGVTLSELLADVADSRPVVVGGHFTVQGHIVCMTGLTAEDGAPVSVRPLDVALIQNVLIADPYGDWHKVDAAGKHYEPKISGYESRYTVDELTELLAPGGGKACIRLTP